MTVGYFAPLPPAPTGVADYANALLGALARKGSVIVNAQSADVNLYQLGNNQLHRQIYEKALANPGVVVLHDAVLHHFFLGAMNEAEYIREFIYNYGEWGRDTAGHLWRTRARSGSDEEFFRYPMLKRIAGVSRAVIVHNEAAAAMVRRHAPGARVVEIPHLFENAPAMDRVETERLRASLGLDSRTTIFGIFGHLRESKRIHSVLRVFERLHSAQPGIALLLAGECVSSDLQRAIEPFLSHPRIIRRGFLPGDAFWLYAHATDVCINLRYPSAGETSGIGVRLMSIGKPVILTDGLEVSRLPEATCLRTPSGVQEEAMLSAYMEWAVGEPRDMEAIGERAAAHIAENHNLNSVANQYWAVLESAAGN